MCFQADSHKQADLRTNEKPRRRSARERGFHLQGAMLFAYRT